MGFSELIESVKKQEAQAAQNAADAAALPKVIQDAKDFKDSLQNDYSAKVADLQNIGLDFSKAKASLDLANKNAQQDTSGTTAQAITVSKTNMIPILLILGVAGYLYYKGKLKI